MDQSCFNSIACQHRSPRCRGEGSNASHASTSRSGHGLGCGVRIDAQRSLDGSKRLMTRALRILHIASGDLWAGAEVQAFTLLCHLNRIPETEVAAVLLNDWTLAEKLR